ncbi:hypothetical protein MLD38_009930 [Melastoma candidum]|uniref:Uncharacterized protein n=1 Tax=Melastoma candidum TaxID=119954 RepID=A0ACB9R1B3_9MYRT|nr:hypothetical protein MLD38_009930 [Melastoma candidum]
MIDQFINFVIRPPRAEYNPNQYLWETDFTLAGKSYKRQDLELTNRRGHRLRCSHYVPSSFPKDTPLPCVIYCHGNSGCRADANEAVIILLPSNITVFTLDFSGSGLSDGEFVSLGWHERDDLRVAVSYLRSIQYISAIGLWGRSMGAVTCMLYGAEDPSIAGMVLDSAFSNLYDLMLELADVYKIRAPKFTVRMAVQYMRRIIIRKAKFDIMDLNCLQVAPKSFIPALFGHANEDKFIQPRHSNLIFKLYAGDKNIIKFDGDHNSSRPQFYYDSVSIFFHNVMHPPQSTPSCPTKDDKYFDLANMKISGSVEENLLYEIIATLRSVGADSASSSSIFPGALTSVSASEHISVNDDLTKGDRLAVNDIAQLQDNDNGVNMECCSLTSSTRESWGRCSSLGGSDDEPAKNSHQTALNAIATPRRNPLQIHKSQQRREEKGKGKISSKHSQPIEAREIR